MSVNLDFKRTFQYFQAFYSVVRFSLKLFLHYTEDEAGQIQEALSNIPTYVNQTMAEFITGARDIESGWDAYMSELKGMGLDEWQKCAQAAYDRSVE